MQRYLVVVGLLLVVGGCNSKLGSTVTGHVTLEGKALTSGDVTFTPVGAGQIAYGKIDASGNYSLTTGNETGVMPGEYIVTVIATGTPPSNDQPPPLLTPEKYSDKATSDLKKTLVPGANKVDLSLTP